MDSIQLRSVRRVIEEERGNICEESQTRAKAVNNSDSIHSAYGPRNISVSSVITDEASEGRGGGIECEIQRHGEQSWTFMPSAAEPSELEDCLAFELDTINSAAPSHSRKQFPESGALEEVQQSSLLDRLLEYAEKEVLWLVQTAVSFSIYQ